MTLGIMQEQHGPELQEIEMNGIYMRRAHIFTQDEHSLNDDDDDDDGVQ